MFYQPQTGFYELQVKLVSDKFSVAWALFCLHSSESNASIQCSQHGPKNLLPLAL